MAGPIEVCEECNRDIAGKMVACVHNGRILCLPCDRQARSADKAEQRKEAADAKAKRKSEDAALKLEEAQANQRQFEANRLVRLLNPDEFYSKIAGTTATNTNGQRRQLLIARLRISEPLVFIREPKNKYDTNAVAIYNTLMQQLGYVTAQAAITVAERMDAGAMAWGEVSDLTGGTIDYPTHGANILIRTGHPYPPPVAAVLG